MQSAVETVDVCIEERILRYNKFAKEWNLRSLEKDDFKYQIYRIIIRNKLENRNWNMINGYGSWSGPEKGQIARMVKKGCGSDQRRSVRNGETRSIRCRGSKA